MADPVVPPPNYRKQLRPTPQPSAMRKLLESLTGYPADPNRETGPMDGINLLLAAMPAAGVGRAALRTADLPLDYASRMARAAEQGYTTPVWHGTKANFQEFLDPITAMQTEGADLGIHVATTPNTANRAIGAGNFVTNDPSQLPPIPRGSNVIPLLARIQNPLTTPDMGIWRSPTSWVNRAYTAPSSSPSAMEDIVRMARNVKKVQGAAAPQQELQFAQDLIDYLQRNGFDAISYRNVIEGIGEPSHLLLDPRQLKSIFARFDPAAFGKTRNILASAGPVGIAGALAAQQSQNGGR